MSYDDRYDSYKSYKCYEIINPVSAESIIHGIFTNTYHQNDSNVGRYSLYGASISMIGAIKSSASAETDLAITKDHTGSHRKSGLCWIVQVPSIET